MAKKSIFLVLVLCLFFSCRQKYEGIEKYIENDVEVIVNHIEPYEIPGESQSFTLGEEFTIDTSLMDAVRVGLFDVVEFAVDSQGDIYCTSAKNPDYYIFKFNRNGRFIDSFGKRGQGPGEIHRYASININSNDEIEIYQIIPNRLSLFNKEGTLIDERSSDSSFSRVCNLENGNYLAFGPTQMIDPSSEKGVHTPLSLLDTEFEKIKELDIRKIPNAATATQMKYSEHVFQWSISNGKIFVANEERGYEILVFDFEGRLIRKIKKEYTPVRIPDAIKQKFKETVKRFAERVYFPENFAPFQSIFTDDRGRLFVTTYEKGPNPGEYIHDIFNSDGVFIARKSFSHSLKSRYGVDIALPALVRNNRLYCLREKESGYRELAVHRIIWK